MYLRFKGNELQRLGSVEFLRGHDSQTVISMPSSLRRLCQHSEHILRFFTANSDAAHDAREFGVVWEFSKAGNSPSQALLNGHVCSAAHHIYRMIGPAPVELCFRA